MLSIGILKDDLYQAHWNFFSELGSLILSYVVNKYLAVQLALRILQIPFILLREFLVVVINFDSFFIGENYLRGDIATQGHCGSMLSLVILRERLVLIMRYVALLTATHFLLMIIGKS